MSIRITGNATYREDIPQVFNSNKFYVKINSSGTFDLATVPNRIGGIFFGFIRFTWSGDAYLFSWAGELVDNESMLLTRITSWGDASIFIQDGKLKTTYSTESSTVAVGFVLFIPNYNF